MSILTGALNTTATLWRWSDTDEYSDPVFDSPIEISVRWEDRNEIFYDEMGNQRRSRSVVYTDQDVSYGDFLYKGSTVTVDPKSVDGSKQVQSVQAVNDLSGGDTVYRVMV